MKPRRRQYILLSAIALASLTGGGEAMAQNNTYNRCQVQHKAGMWYDDNFGHNRGQGSNPDNFDEGQGTTANQRGMKVNPYNTSIRIQKTHESIETIYINPGETKTITVPSTRLSDYSSMRYYQRWYNLRTDGNINTTWITPTGKGTRYQMSDGVYSGAFLGLADQEDLPQVKITGPSSFADNQPYILACDMSDYTDMEFSGGRLDNGETFTEPTLGQRVIYVIMNASVIKRTINTNTYYETHDIHFPTVRTSDNTPEQVSLNMSANNYYVSGEDEDCGTLTAEIDYNGWTNGDDHVYLVRTIPNTEEGHDGEWEWKENEYGQLEPVWVPNNNEYGNALDNGRAHETLDISGEHRKITFMMQGDIPDGQVIYINVKKNGYLIAQFKVTFDANTQAITESNIKTIELDDDNALYFRTNAYLEDEENGFTRLATLNFDFDNVSTYETTSKTGVHFYPYPLGWEMSSYGFYSPENSYKSNDNQVVSGPKDYPEWGQYAITNGNGWQSGTDLLDNSKYHLYVDANQYPGTICELPFNATFCRSSKLFVTAWVRSLDPSKADANILFILKGNRADGTQEIIHTQASGQINDTGSHPWYQIYFEFTSPSDYNFEKGYTLELFNNCAAASGADFCVDDIRVYLSPLEVGANISTPLCTTDSEAEVNVDINYEMLLNRLGIEEQKTSTSAQKYTGYYSFVNKTVFDNLVANGTSYQEAFAQAVVHGQGVYQGSQHEYFGTINFSNHFASNNGQGGMVNSEGRGNNRRITFNANVAANNTADGYVTLVAGDDYYIVFSQDDNISSINKAEDLAEYYEMDDPICGIRGTFTVNGPLIINVDGEVSTAASTVCIGQTPLIDVEMRDNNGQVVEDAVFDWYFGSYTDFRNEQTEPIATGTGQQETHDLAQALERFRINYPDANSVGDNIVPVTDGEDEHLYLYQEDIDLIKQLNEDYSVGGLNPKLTLSASRNLQVRLMGTETYIVVIPVGTEPTPSEGEEMYAICWEPTQMLLHAQDGAPLMDVGRQDANYDEAGDYAVKVRIGKLQLDNMNQLQVPVRDPRLEDGTSASVSSIDNDQNVYLNWTDDPRYLDQLVELGAFQKKVGIVQRFNINSNGTADNMHVILSLDNQTDFEPREGYQYNFGVRFSTNTVTGEEDCYGNLLIPVVVVPDYEVWIGGSTGNWNDDANWRRAEPTDIKKTSNYITNEQNGTENGFVPLAATRVVIPSDKGILLYEAPQKANAGGILDLDTHKGELSSPTANIEYDLTVEYNESLRRFVAGLYNANECYRLHFDARAQMGNSHLLSYDRAWTNVEVPTEQWTTIATPLQGVFTGDWYTKSTGLESAEYFTDLEFSTGNNRLQPYVLQRSWNEHAVINDNGDGTESGHTDGAHTSEVTWSSTYNDVDIQTKPGEGFSILAGKGSQTADGGMVEFRLPKEDTKYDGFDATFERRQVDAGRLFTDNLQQTEKTSVKVSPSHDGNYLLVGNPFTASLDMEEFFQENTSLEKVYWVDGGDPYTAVESDDLWISSNGDGKALVPPYTAFYVKQTTKSTSPLDITFSRNMAVMDVQDDTETQGLQGFILQATGKNGGSTALLRYEGTAENGFVNGEDVQLMTHASGITTPMVYTTAGDMAASINQVKDLQRIPLGLFAADNEVTNLTFRGVSTLREPTLHDELEGTATPITEGMTLQIAGSSHGRYYITSLGGGDGTTGIEETTATEDAVEVSSPAHRQVVVTANSGIEGISIYSANGTLLRRVSPKGETTCTIDGVASGVAVVMVKTASNNETSKIIIK